MQIVSVKNLCKEYPSFRLQDITFSLDEGTVTGFIGRNGAGKTTTINSMLNLTHPDSGEIQYFGVPLKGNEAQIKQRICYSTGAISWYPNKPIRLLADVIRRFYPTWNEGAYRKYLSLFELDESKTPQQLSEGMKVKCNLLLALSHRAEVLILDEPTSGLDPFSRDELLELFRMLRKEGIAILFSTHIVSDLEKCADHILYISRGRMIAFLPKSDFVQRISQDGESLEQTILRIERSVER